MYKKCENNNTLNCTINDKLRAEIEALNESRPRDINLSMTIRYLLWLGLKHYYLFSDTKKGRAKGQAIGTAEDQARQADSGIYISKL